MALQIAELPRRVGIEEIMGFVEDDPVRKSGPLPQRVQDRQRAADVFDLLVELPVRQVDDETAIGITQRPHQLAWRRRRFLAAEDRHAGQRFERSIVALRIDHADAVAVQNELLAQQPCDP